MDAPAYTAITAASDAGVWTITLNRPAARNAMSLTMVGELLQALSHAEADNGARAIVLRGAGGHFCAGGDLVDMARARMQPAQSDSDPVAEVNAAFGRLCVAYADTRLPVVAVLQGTVMGGGLGLACVADVVLADGSAVFRLPETSLGLVPAQIAPFLVERLGLAEARRLALTGMRLDARAAAALRLIHELAADAAALEAALARVLGDILRCAPGALAETKALLARCRGRRAAELVDEAAAVFARAVRSAEGQEGTAAFVQKRPPSWAPSA